MEKKFTAFRVFATFYKIASVLMALFTILVVLLLIVGIGAGDRSLRQYGVENTPIVAFLIVVFVFITGALSSVGIYALGEAMYLLISLEENTRFTSILLRDRFYPQPPNTQPVQPLPPSNPPAI
jgi:hypothetical protein